MNVNILSLNISNTNVLLFNIRNKNRNIKLDLNIDNINGHIINGHISCHIQIRLHSQNRPRWSRDYKIDDISLNRHTNSFKLNKVYTYLEKNQLLVMY